MFNGFGRNIVTLGTVHLFIILLDEQTPPNTEGAITLGKTRSIYPNGNRRIGGYGFCVIQDLFST